MFNPSEGLSVLAYRLPLYILFICGMFWCIRIAQRPTTHKRCVIALIVCLFGWAVTTTTPVLRGFANYSVMGNRIGTINIGFAIVVFFLATVLGVISLRDYSHHAEQLNQGKAQAKWAIGLSISALVILIPFFIWSFSNWK